MPALLGDHANDAFSVMRLDSFRHFLRLKINGDELTAYPVGIDRSPPRSGWKKNGNFVEGDQNTPFFVPRNGLGQHLIEGPIVIRAADVATLKTRHQPNSSERSSATRNHQLRCGEGMERVTSSRVSPSRAQCIGASLLTRKLQNGSRRTPATTVRGSPTIETQLSSRLHRP